MPKKPFYKYADDVINGKKVVGEYERLMVERFFSDLEKGEFIFDYDKGERMVKFAAFCNHHKGDLAGKPIILEPHQQFIEIQKFGWLKENGTRRFSTSYKKVARGNGKTTELAVESIFMACKDGEAGAQIYCGATKEEQARILVNDAGSIIDESPLLRNRFHLFKFQDSVKRVVHPESKSLIAALGKNSRTDDGFDPYAGQIDEYHAHVDNGVRNIIESGMVKRSQPLMNIITTAGYNKYGPCYKFENMCKDVLKGTLEDDGLLISIYDLDKEDIEDDNWQNPDLWCKANPNMGASVNFDVMRQRLKTCLNEGMEQIVDFKTKNINMWTDASTIWIQSHIWNDCDDKVHLNGQDWYMGCDMSSTKDYTAVSFVAEDDKGILDIISYGFIPEETFNGRLKTETVNLYEWIKDGYVIATPGNATDYDYIEQFIKDKYNEMKVKFGAVDKWNATQLIQRVGNDGNDIAEIPNNMANLSEPAKYLERKVLRKEVRHNGNPALAWMISNCVPQYDSKGNLWINKEFPENKIDIPKSVIFAIRAMMERTDEQGGSIDVW